MDKIFAIRESLYTKNENTSKYLCKDERRDILINEVTELAEDEHEYNKFKYDYNKVSLSFRPQPVGMVAYSAVLRVLGDFQIHSFDVVLVSVDELKDVPTYEEYFNKKQQEVI